MTANKSAVKQLQKLAINPVTNISHLLRLSLTVATKLNLSEIHELEGYSAAKDIPEYRWVTGSPKLHNPINGWIPVLSENRKYIEQINKLPVGMSIGEVENNVKTQESGSVLIMHYPPAMEAEMMKQFEVPFKPALFLPPTANVGILEAVRNKILDWALELESQGIEGDELEFTEKEQEVAASSIYNIQQVGVLGNVKENASANVNQTGSIHVNDLDAVKDLLLNIKYSCATLPDAIEDDVVANVDAALSEIEKDKPNKNNIASNIGSIKSIAEGAAGNITAQGILAALGSFII